MTASTPERPVWRDWPELRVVRASTVPDTAGGHTCNHDAAKTAHVARLATPGIAPGPPIAPRRRIVWSIVSDIAVLTLVLLAVIGAFAVARGLLGGM